MPGSPARRSASWAMDYDAADYEQVQDIVEVWFDHGCTHAFVWRTRGHEVAGGLYLEGSDQHRGWFHSSLLESLRHTWPGTL